MIQMLDYATACELLRKAQQKYGGHTVYPGVRKVKDGGLHYVWFDTDETGATIISPADLPAQALCLGGIPPVAFVEHRVVERTWMPTVLARFKAAGLIVESTAAGEAVLNVAQAAVDRGHSWFAAANYATTEGRYYLDVPKSQYPTAYLYGG